MDTLATFLGPHSTRIPVEIINDTFFDRGTVIALLALLIAIATTAWQVKGNRNSVWESSFRMSVADLIGAIIQYANTPQLIVQPRFALDPSIIVLQHAERVRVLLDLTLPDHKAFDDRLAKLETEVAKIRGNIVGEWIKELRATMNRLLEV